MTRVRTVFVRGLVLQARIGVYDSEQHGTQRIRVDVSFDVADPGGIGDDTLGRVVDYGEVADTVRREVASGHVHLVETLAERIAHSLLQDVRKLTVRVQVEKLDILPDGGTAGVAITRHQPICPPPELSR